MTRPIIPARANVMGLDVADKTKGRLMTDREITHARCGARTSHNMQDAISIDPDERLRDIIAECVAASSIKEEAVEALLERVRADAALYRALMSPLEAQAASIAVGCMIREERRATWARPAAPDDRVSALASMTHSLMDFRLPSGKRLRDATGEECDDAAAFYETRARDMAWKARWLRLIAQRAGSATVCDALDVGALTALREEANV